MKLDIAKGGDTRADLYGHYRDLHTFMMDDDEFRSLVESGFAAEPIPHCFFWSDGDCALDQDIPEELARRIERRSWKDVTILDWRMVGAPPSISRSYLEPTTFIYYLPSLIIGSYRDIAYVDFALEAIIPYNKSHNVRGKWWGEFSKSISPLQRKILREFVSRIRYDRWNKIDLSDQALVQHAACIWSEARK